MIKDFVVLDILDDQGTAYEQEEEGTIKAEDTQDNSASAYDV